METTSAFDELIGSRVTEAGPDRTVVELPVSRALHQPGGIVHGGVYCALVEGAASTGATLWLEGSGIAVGTSNHTDFLKAVRDGVLRAEATPLQRGSRLQLWQVEVTDGTATLVAHGKVKLLNLRETPG